MKWLKSIFSPLSPQILDENQISAMSTPKLLEFLKDGYISRRTGERITTEILHRFYLKLGE